MRTTISIIVSEHYGNIRTVSDENGNQLYCLKDIRKRHLILQEMTSIFGLKKVELLKK